MQNPLSKDVMLADEVGMSKTIEVARVLCQLRAVAQQHCVSNGHAKMCTT